MLNLNFEQVGIQVCDIKSNDHPKKQGTSIFLASPEEASEIHHGFGEWTLQTTKGKDYHFELAVNTKVERSILYISGQSGSGKSFFTHRYCDAYHKCFPDRQIYLFSAVNEDPSVDSIKNLHRIALTHDLVADELSAVDFENSLVIFDDTDSLIDKKIKKCVSSIQASILTTGRHFKTSCIITSHVAAGGNETKLVLNESNSITLFPNSMSSRSLKYILESYLGLSKEQIKKIKKLPGRAVTIVKNYQKCVVSDKECYVLENE